MPSNNNKRLTVLSSEEINNYFGLPQFSDAERKHYFSLSKNELKICQTLSPQTQWYFILQLGYFKAKKHFFILDYTQTRKDTHFITKIYQCRAPQKNISEETHRKIRRMIIRLLGFNDKS